MNEKLKIQTFFDLTAWQKAHEVTLQIYHVTSHFPRDEMFGLTNQMRRAAISAESNIAEGFGRSTAKDKQHFYAMAKGPENELQSQVRTAYDLNYLSETEYTELQASLLDALRLCFGMIRSAKDFVVVSR